MYSRNAPGTNSSAASGLIIRMPRTLIAACEQEVSRTFPLESGGVLMGTRSDSGAWLIDHVIGPGPQAKHAAYSFYPDMAYQVQAIARRFAETGGRSTYLGDWHSHPRAMHGRLSTKDRSALKTIASAPAAQCPNPLMLILWGQPGAWEPALWSGAYQAPRMLMRRFAVQACRLEVA